MIVNFKKFACSSLSPPYFECSPHMLARPEFILNYPFSLPVLKSDGSVVKKFYQ